MRWSDIGETCLRRQRSSNGDLYPICIHWHRRDMGTSILKHSPGSRIAWVLHPDAISPVYEQPYHKIQGGLCPRSNQDLIGLTANPTGDGDMGYNGLTQRAINHAPLI